MAAWVNTDLGNLVEVEHGYAFKGEHFSESGDYVLLTPGNFHEKGGFKLRPGKDRSYTADFPRRYLLRKDEVIVAMTEQAEGLLGSTARIPENDVYLLNQRLGRLHPNTQRADRRFLYYLFNTNVVRQQIRNSSSGAKVRHTSPKRIYATKVRVPDIPIQRKIAGVLSAYDDLIENNRRRIAILENMAEEIYREWFVRMRFPGHQNAKFRKGVPEGWEVKKLPELADITYGYPFKSSQFNTNGIGMPIVRIRNIRDSQTGDYTDERVDSRYLIHPGEFLIGMDGEFHMNHWCGETALLVQRTCRVKAKDPLLDGYLAHALHAPIKHLEATLVGATVAHLGAKHLNDIDVLVPHQCVREPLQQFNGLRDQKVRIAVINRKLAKIRDALLTRLISGKLSVDDLDIRLPPSMIEDAEPARAKAVHA